MKAIIEKLMVDYQQKHSDYQIQNFIIGSQGSDWAKYNQALREIDARWNQLLGLEDAMELFNLKTAWAWPFGKRAQIRKKQMERNRKSMGREINETKRELQLIVDLAVELKEKIGVTDDHKKIKLEADAWQQKAIKMAGIDLLVNGRVGSTTLNFILSLPKPDQAMVIEHFKPGAKVDPFKMIGL